MDDYRISQQKFIELIINYKMKETRQFSKKKRKMREQVQIQQAYFKQILRNIENIQTTILKKLQKHPQTPSKPFLTPRAKKQRKMSSSNKKIDKNAYHSERLTTTINRAQGSLPNKQKNINFTDYGNYQTIKMKTQCRQICKPLQSSPIVSGFQLRPYQANPLSILTKTTRFSPPCGKQAQNKQNIKQLQFARTNRDAQKCLRNSPQQYYSYRIDPPPKAHRNPTENIEQFYQGEIEKLQLQNKISSLQQELQRCIFQKKKADYCQSCFLKAKMKKISLEMKQLKSINENKQ